MTEVTRHRVAVVSPVWKDYTGEAMIEFDSICRRFNATPCGVTFPGGDSAHVAIFHIIGDDVTVWNVKYEIGRHFPECKIILDPSENDEFWHDRDIPMDAIFSQFSQGGKCM